MRSLITGGAGFIGSHFAEQLLRHAHQVSIIDDLSTGSIENITSIKSHSRFEYHLDSIFNRQLLAELIDHSDVIFHLAAAVGVRRIVEYPVRTIIIRALAEKVVAATGSSSCIQLIPYTEAYGDGFEDMEHRMPDISKAAEWFGFAPSRSLGDCVQSVIEYVKQQAQPRAYAVQIA